MSDEQPTTEQMVRANLEQRLGALIGENIELRLRIHELEQQQNHDGD